MNVTAPDELKALLSPDMAFYKDRLVKYLEYRVGQEYKRIVSASPKELEQIQTRVILLEDIIRKLNTTS
jgi:hypothetical protein